MLPESNGTENKEKGFTFLELLIVVAIIGILAAIAIPQFTQYKQRIYDNDSKANLENIYLACKAYWAEENDNKECTPAIAKGATYGFNPSTNVVVTITVGAKTGFTATAKHNSSLRTFIINSKGDIG